MRTRTCTHAGTHTRAHTHVHTRTGMHMHTQAHTAHTLACTHTHMHMNMHTCVCAHMHTDTHVRTCTRAHATRTPTFRRTMPIARSGSILSAKRRWRGPSPETGVGGGGSHEVRDEPLTRRPCHSSHLVSSVSCTFVGGLAHAPHGGQGAIKATLRRPCCNSSPDTSFLPCAHYAHAGPEKLSIGENGTGQKGHSLCSAPPQARCDSNTKADGRSNWESWQLT